MNKTNYFGYGMMWGGFLSVIAYLLNLWLFKSDPFLFFCFMIIIIIGCFFYDTKKNIL